MPRKIQKPRIRFIDLFCCIAGFRIAAEQAASLIGATSECVLSSDIDEFCQHAYERNFGERPVGGIAMLDTKQIPSHDLLLAGFSCQPFCIIGRQK